VVVTGTIMASTRKIVWSFGRTHEEIHEMRDTFDVYFQVAHNHRLVLMEGFKYDEHCWHVIALSIPYLASVRFHLPGVLKGVT